MDSEIKNMIALQAFQGVSGVTCQFQPNFNQTTQAATIHQKIGNLKRL